MKVNFKIIKKEQFFLGNCKSSTYACAYQGGCALVLEKILTKGTRRGQDHWSYAFGKFPHAGGQSSRLIWLRADHSIHVTELLPSHTLNTYITLVELLRALKKLQKNMVASLDGMKAEFLLDARELLHMPLLITLNYFMAEGFLKALFYWGGPCAF